MPRSRSTSAGFTALEVAACLPIIVVIAFAALEACTMIRLQQSLTVAAYEGARVGLLPGAATDDARYQTELLLSGRNVKGFQVEVSPEIESAPAGAFISVTAKAPCAENTMIGRLFPNERTLTGRVEMMKEY